MNAGKYQFLVWPRWKLFFWRPRKSQRDLTLYAKIYRWIVYVWPVEIRRFR